MKWDNNALEKIKGGKINIYNFYIFDLYKKLTNKFIEGVVNESSIKVLKTDLWDFVVEKDRDILSYLYSLRCNWEYCGIDISEEIINKAKSLTKNKQFNFLFSDIRRLEYNNNSFDLVFDFSTIDHVLESELEQVIKEYYRVLKPGGKVLIIFWQASLFIKFLSFFYKIFLKKPIIENNNLNKFQYYFRVNDVVSLANKEGFIVKKNKYYLGSFLNILRGPFKVLYLIIPKKFFTLCAKLETSRISVLFKSFSALCAIELVKPYNTEKIQEFWNNKILKNSDLLSGVLWDNNRLWNIFIDLEQKILLRKYVNKIKINNKVLDFGCGTGRLSKIFLKKTDYLYAIDTSGSAIEICQNNLAGFRINFFTGSINDAGFAPNFFDYIFSITALQSVNNIEELHATLEEFNKILKKSGRVILLESLTHKRGDPLVLNIKDDYFLTLAKKNNFKVLKFRNIDNVFIRKVYFKCSEKKTLQFFGFVIIIIIAIIELTPIGIFFRSKSWYKLVILEKN